MTTERTAQLSTQGRLAGSFLGAMVISSVNYGGSSGLNGQVADMFSAAFVLRMVTVNPKVKVPHRWRWENLYRQLDLYGVIL